MPEPPVIRLVRPITEPLGLFLRPGHNDHRILLQLLSEGRSSMTGVVFDPTSIGAQEELRNEVRRRNLWAVLDTRFMELATPNGHNEKRAALPWAGPTVHRPQDLSGAAGQSAAKAVVEFADRNGFNALLMGHYLERGLQDTWFAIDVVQARELRRQLHLRGLDDVALYYALALPTSVFNNASMRAAIKARLTDLDVDGLWLRVHPFGASSGHVTLHRFIDACRDLHSLGYPLIVEKAGSIGLALLAFGAVSGLESGVSSGDKFDFARLSKPRDTSKKPFAPHARVYIPGLGIFLDRDTASAFFANRSLKASFGCQNAACCRRGSQDTISDPRRHFVFTRMEEVGAINQVPSALRPNQYLDTVLRPATDRLGRVLQSSLGEEIKVRLEKERQKLDGWRHTLGEISRTQPALTLAPTPARRVARRRGA
jgi:hypothetical protein